MQTMAGLALCLLAFPAFSQPPPHPAICNCSAVSPAPTEVRVCSTNNPAGCNLTVLVTKTEVGECTAKLDYCVLCVRRKDTPDGLEQTPKVTWTLSPAAKARFNGVDGIAIDLDPIDPEFVSPTPGDAPPQTISLTAAKGRNLTAAHSALLFPLPNGRTCRSAPATIVNTDQ